MIAQLEHAVELAQKYAGKIIGYSVIPGSAVYLDDPDNIQHWKGRHFVPIEDVHIFDNPLSSEQFSEYVKINRQGTNTPISSDKDFQGLKKLLIKNNELSRYLETAKIGDKVFRNINKENWKEISCSDDAKFSREDQIRSYLIDYFLNEIKDNRTPLLEECNCYKKSENTGISDYFIKFNKEWIPVEAKLNILAERDIKAQISKYINIDSIKPIKGTHSKKTFDTSKQEFCLVIDHSGLYTFYKNDFIKCEPGKPFINRIKMKNTKKARDSLLKLLETMESY